MSLDVINSKMKIREQRASKWKTEKYKVSNTKREKTDWAKCNIHVISISEKKKKECGTKTVLKEIMVEISPNLVKKINLQIQIDEWTPKRINTKNHML